MVSCTVIDADNVTSVQVSIGGVFFSAENTGGDNWLAEVDTTQVGDGAQTIDVTSTDAAGDSATASIPVTVSNQSTPTT